MPSYVLGFLISSNYDWFETMQSNFFYRIFTETFTLQPWKCKTIRNVHCFSYFSNAPQDLEHNKLINYCPHYRSINYHNYCESHQVPLVSGQALNATQTQALEKLDHNAPWHERLIVKHRRLVGVAIPFIFYQVLWWSCAIEYSFWSLFPDRYFISITMIFGSMIAGKKVLFVAIS